MEYEDEVKLLAVSYNAYCNAVQEEDSSGVSMWGCTLKRSQRVIGVELVPEERINNTINILGTNPEVWIESVI